MPIDSNARVAVLVGTLSGSPLPLSLVEPQVCVPAIYLRVGLDTPPLDVPRFHYRVFRDGSVIPLHQHLRRCAHPRHRCHR